MKQTMSAWPILFVSHELNAENDNGFRLREIIHELEPEARGAYGGAVGYFSSTGNMDLAIVIRTLEINHGVLTLQAGAGIVADSVPEKEYEECLNKAKASLQSLELAQEVEQ